MKTSESTSGINAASTNGAQYFDFVTRGIGLVSRIRDVSGNGKGPRRASTPSVYCQISVPLDPQGTPNARWTSFDVRVCGPVCNDLINSLREQVATGKRPRIEFSIGDVYADTYEKETPQGLKPVGMLKGRLINAALASVDAVKPLSTHGLAYVNSVRLNGNDEAVRPLYTTVSAFHGMTDALNYVQADLYSANDNVANVLLDVRALQRDDNDANKTRILTSIVIRNLGVKSFVRRDKTSAACLTGALEQIKLLRINGQVVESASANALTDPTDDASPQV